MIRSRGQVVLARAGLALAGAASLAACAPAARERGTPAVATAPGAACTFANPIAEGADPWLEFRDGYYYMAQSRNPEGQRSSIWVFRSRKLTDPMQDSVRVWTSPETGWNQTHIWAPEIRFVDGRWYIYYAGGRPGPSDAPFIHQRAGVLRAATGDPRGTWEDLGQLDTGGQLATRDDDIWAIDFTVHRLNGQLYGFWSGWENNTPLARTPQYIYIARMTDPATVGGPRVRIAAPTESWERRVDPTDGLDLTEGPQVLEHNGNAFVIYSTRESWTRAYRLGQLRLNSRTADPMQPGSWTKTGPVFAEANGVYGPGHNGFTKSPDGREDWIVYHAKVDTGPNWNRVIRAQRFTWRADGSPDFGEPVAAGVPLPVPSGEPCGR
ncbi:MAG TPA: glycoside hydrolase family 43 protein [Longimicrobium sp.]|jgi:GH43 family beta-xylosidase|uniref:glycoside hydrolase family 43 protein n=1 Tax=Longimicrobium sp. TaxID=2029185 RepID=UPI002EDABFF7